ncbi:hypothetical protein ES702_05086 [subsurface metagenome]
MAEKGLLPCVFPSEFTNTSRVIHKGPCIVACVMMAADGANADCQVYDGVNDKGKQKAHIEAVTGTTFGWCPGKPTDFDNGIYIAVNAATSKVTVTYLPESRKRFI